ncbi:uncharacterized protein LOC131151012 [Malania oleifera]|uniref:uncharacterized protein LOC131151012 n=1 Tax=Malania oleifera TaxID=397392 RepID=UPI0025AEA546|nr:uncharacterized protein LOC131151012 [Malania oleifera]
MTEALFEHDQSLRSVQANSRRLELDLVQKCRAKAFKDFKVGAVLGACGTWLVTRRLNNLLRISLSGGAAISCGYWRFYESIYTSVDHLLALNGSQVQNVLANRILKQHSNNPWIMGLISKHFYSERVFDDSTSDQPKLRWRYRNFFGDSFSYGERTHDSGSPSQPDHIRADLKSKQVPVNLGIEAVADPLDCVFGYSGLGEVIHHSGTSSSSPRIVTRSHKRFRHGRRIRHREVSSNPIHA